MRPSRVASLRAQGFDLSEAVPFEARWRVRCSGCEALVINGTPTHERGCPNTPRDSEDDDAGEWQ